MAEPQHPAGADRVRLALNTTCREDMGFGNGYCTERADVILWGKLLPPHALGPRCLGHAAKHLGWPAMSKLDKYAVLDLRPIRAALDAAEAERDDAVQQLDLMSEYARVTRLEKQDLEAERRQLVDALRELVDAASPFLGNETACKGCHFCSCEDRLGDASLAAAAALREAKSHEQ